MRRSLTKKEQKQRERFRMLACATIEAAGGSRDPRGQSYEYVMPTLVGPLRLTVYEDWVACRFASPAGGTAARCGCNPHSGKWNFHAATDRDWLDALLKWLRYELTRLLAYQPT